MPHQLVQEQIEAEMMGAPYRDMGRPVGAGADVQAAFWAWWDGRPATDQEEPSPAHEVAFLAGYAAGAAAARGDLLALLRELRAYTAELEANFAPFVVTRPSMASFPNPGALKARLDAALEAGA